MSKSLRRVQSALQEAGLSVEIRETDDSARTAEGACWRLVECGSYPLDGAEDGDLDWGRCVGELESMSTERATIVMACIASSTCDELLAPGSPNPWEWPACFAYGDQ